MGKKTDEISAVEVCKAFGITRRTLRNWQGKGCPHKPALPGGSVMFSAAELRAWVQGGGPGKRGRPRGGSAKPKSGDESGDLREQLDEAELRKRIAQAEKLELHVKRARGILVESSEVEASNVRKFTAVRQAFESLAGKVASELVGLGSAEIEALLADEVRSILSELSRK